MTQEQAEFLKRVCHHLAVSCEVRNDYSGRCMYGRSTWAIVIPNPNSLLSCVVTYIKELGMDPEDIPEFPEDFSTDSMGFDKVVY